MKAMNADAHVFMEKPIATKNEDAERVVATTRAKTASWCLGNILRVHPSWMKLYRTGAEHAW